MEISIITKQQKDLMLYVTIVSDPLSAPVGMMEFKCCETVRCVSRVMQDRLTFVRSFMLGHIKSSVAHLLIVMTLLILS